MSAPSKEEIASEVAASKKEMTLTTPSVRAAIVVSLADENERLRAELSAALDAKATLMAEREQFRSLSEKQRALISEQDAEHAKLRAERAECLALLDDDRMPPTWPVSFCSYPLTDECGWATRSTPCYQHRRRAMIAKLRGQP